MQPGMQHKQDREGWQNSKVWVPMTKVKTEYQQEPKFLTTCYLRGGILYVPHYKDADKFVGPGYCKQNVNCYSADLLLNKGAVETSEMLWSRSKDHVVQH
jgi:hypothetical protein